MTHTIEVSEYTSNMLTSYFGNEKNHNQMIRRLFAIALDKSLQLMSMDKTELELRLQHTELTRIKVTNITFNRLMNYFPNEPTIDHRIRKLFELVLRGKRKLKPMTDAHLNLGNWNSP